MSQGRRKSTDQVRDELGAVEKNCEVKFSLRERTNKMGSANWQYQKWSGLYHPRLYAYLFAMSWVFTVAACVAFINWLPVYVGGLIENWKFDNLDTTLKKDGGAAVVFSFVGYALWFSLIAALIVYRFGPTVGGSGLPPLISYVSCGYQLNPDFMSLQTLILKSIAMTFVVLSGVSVGREGPAIHLGAAAALLAGGFLRSTIKSLRNTFPWLLDSLSTLDAGDWTVPFSGKFTHELILIGGACGFACAFNAPLGGMMFVFEEISIHWTQHEELSGRIFLAVGLAIFFFDLLQQGTVNSYAIEYDSIVIYDTVNNEVDESWKYEDIPWFLMMAIFIGITTGFIQCFGYKCYEWHKTFVDDGKRSVVNAVGVAIITAFLLGSAPFAVHQCSEIPSEEELEDLSGELRFVSTQDCHEDEYNQMATLTLSSAEDAIKHLFSKSGLTIKLGTLMYFWMIYVFTFCIQLGTAVPAGNFVPNVLMGGLLGRFFGEAALMAVGCRLGETCQYVSNPGVYAIVGATSQLVSWTRTMPAMMVTMFEVTSDTSLAVPMLVCSCLSRAICNLFNTDGWAHCILHAPFIHFPLRKVKPEFWPDEDTMPPEDRLDRYQEAAAGLTGAHGHEKHQEATTPVTAVRAVVQADAMKDGALSQKATTNPMTQKESGEDNSKMKDKKKGGSGEEPGAKPVNSGPSRLSAITGTFNDQL